MVSQKFIEEQPQILRLTTPRLKSTPGAPFAQDDKLFYAALLSLRMTAMLSISDLGH
jgi:cystathionine beta-lyase/cystathionine gamma-synthase